jgi:uracil-DNA glycosylase
MDLHQAENSSVLQKQFPENLPEEWRTLLKGELSKDYFQKLIQFLNTERRSKTRVFPEKENVLRALQCVDYSKVKVVILGQDPYHGAGQAIGLSFGVPNALTPKPPSLKNIFKELSSDLGIEIPKGESDLAGWAKQGVLLLNTVLTVRESQPFSHRDRGWENFTDHIIVLLSQRENPLVFILWGGPARKKKALIDLKKHKIVESAHPSPLSAHQGFLGSKPFSSANKFLKEFGYPPIDWAQISGR